MTDTIAAADGWLAFQAGAPVQLGLTVGDAPWVHGWLQASRAYLMRCTTLRSPFFGSADPTLYGAVFARARALARERDARQRARAVAIAQSLQRLAPLVTNLGLGFEQATAAVTAAAADVDGLLAAAAAGTHPMAEVEAAIDAELERRLIADDPI